MPLHILDSDNGLYYEHVQPRRCLTLGARIGRTQAICCLLNGR